MKAVAIIIAALAAKAGIAYIAYLAMLQTSPMAAGLC